MITNERRYEIIEACYGLIDSPNITKVGKLEAETKKEELIREIFVYTINEENGMRGANQRKV